jgi:hypothetical protein
MYAVLRMGWIYVKDVPGCSFSGEARRRHICVLALRCIAHNGRSPRYTHRQHPSFTMGDRRCSRKLVSHCLAASELMLQMDSWDEPVLRGVASTLSNFSKGLSKDANSAPRTSSAALDHALRKHVLKCLIVVQAPRAASIKQVEQPTR